MLLEKTGSEEEAFKLAVSLGYRVPTLEEYSEYVEQR